METKLAALALIRASMVGDMEALRVVVDNNPPSHELTAELVKLTAGMLEHALGEEQATAVIERWMRSLLSAQ